MTGIPKTIAQAVIVIKEADALLVSAGAGMGVDSGLPDFRGNRGFWKAYPPIAKLGISFSQMANPRWFEEDPELAWGFYGHRLNLYRRTVPHDGFQMLLDMGEDKPGGIFVFTSNVDGQFQKAGFPEDRIVECHGSIHHFQCTTPCSEHIWDASSIDIQVDEANLRGLPPLPRCPDCGALARPNILMFGDWSWISHRTENQEHAFNRWLDNLRQNHLRLAIIEIGAGEAVPTVRMTSERVASSLNATLIRINPRDYRVPGGHIALPYGGKEGIGLIFSGLRVTR